MATDMTTDMTTNGGREKRMYDITDRESGTHKSPMAMESEEEEGEGGQKQKQKK